MDISTLLTILIPSILLLMAIAILFIRLSSNEEKTRQILYEQYREQIQTMNANNEALTKKFYDLQKEVTKSLHEGFRENNENINSALHRQKESYERAHKLLMQTINDQLLLLSEKVEKRLSKGFEKSQETFTEIMKTISKITEAQKKIEQLGENVVSLQNILTNKNSRGIFGETQLEQILKTVFGEKNRHIYSTQHVLSNRTKCDAILFMPPPALPIVIDSKFPLENFQKMIDKESDLATQATAMKLFKTDMLKHIDDISKKYIIANETANYAILFLPAEAIFAELLAYHYPLVEKAHTKGVMIASPTTLLAMLSAIQYAIKDVETKEQAQIIQQELAKLSQEFGRYHKRWSQLEKNIDRVSRDVKDVSITSSKISQGFERIEQVEFADNQKVIEGD